MRMKINTYYKGNWGTFPLKRGTFEVGLLEQVAWGGGHCALRSAASVVYDVWNVQLK